MKNLGRLARILSATGLILTSPAAAWAGIFDLPAFLEPGKFSVGAEPEVILSNGTGAGINLKPKIGHTEFLNWEGMIGTGSGPRKFRIGVTADFDWFPDVDNQPGFATPLFIDYYRYNSNGLLIFGAKPLVYKTFKGKEAAYTPFIALPIGWSYAQDSVTGFVQVALGSMFKFPGQDHWKFTAEVGFDASHAWSYISGGVTYFH